MLSPQNTSKGTELYQNTIEGFWYYKEDIINFITKERKKKTDWESIRHKIYDKFKRVIRSADYLRKQYNNIQNTVMNQIGDIDEIRGLSYKNVYKDFQNCIKRTKISINTKKKIKKGKNVVISDIHSPFYNQEILAFIIKEHSDAECLYIDGDTFDLYCASRFDKSDDIILREEIIKNTFVIDMLAKAFNKIVIVRGNHDNRVERYFRKRVDPTMMFLVQADILDLITKEHDNITIADKEYKFPNGMGSAIVGHFTKIGNDAFIGHFENAKKEPVKTVVECMKHIESWESYYKLNPIRLFLQAHTHSLGGWYRRGGAILIGETGCCCQVQGYQTTPRIGWEPNTPGFWLVYQDKDGNTDLQLSRPIAYGEW